MATTDMALLTRTVGRAIARHRQRAGLTQEQVAEQLGIGNEAVSRIERGVVMPTVARLVELAGIFGCDVADLLTETSHRSDDQAQYLSRLLAGLAATDRQLLLGVIETLVQRLAGDPGVPSDVPGAGRPRRAG